VLLSLGNGQPWHWISNKCAAVLVDCLLISTDRAALDVLRERERQVSAEGWTPGTR
jgi:hypothetical protein